MKAIIKCVCPQNSWTNNFDTINPYMIPVLDKPIIEFYIDYCLLCGVSEIVVVAQEYDIALFSHIKSMGKWGTPVSIEIDDGTLLQQDPNDIYFDKFALICYDKNFKDGLATIENLRADYGDMIDEEIVSMPEKIGGLPPIVPLQINSLKQYFDINMSLLNKYTSCFLMKGYGGEDGVFMGMNDIVMYKAELTPPLVVDDNTQIECACKIGGSVIIGKLSLIDQRTTIRNSIVFDRTYIGENLTIDGKIVFRQNIIDSETEEKTRMPTSFEMSDTYAYVAIKAVERLFERTLALLLFVGLAPFYVLSIIFGKPKYSEIELLGKNEQKWKIRLYTRSPRLRDIYFFKFSQDKLPFLWATILGKIRLVGDSIQVATDPKNMKFYGKHYRVGAFTYSGSIGKKDNQWRVMDDLHYKNHRTIKTDLQVVLRSLVSRIFGDQSK